jgi:hypothetical protein
MYPLLLCKRMMMPMGLHDANHHLETGLINQFLIRQQVLSAALFLKLP